MLITAPGSVFTNIPPEALVHNNVIILVAFLVPWLFHVSQSIFLFLNHVFITTRSCFFQKLSTLSLISRWFFQLNWRNFPFTMLSKPPITVAFAWRLPSYFYMLLIILSYLFSISSSSWSIVVGMYTYTIIISNYTLFHHCHLFNNIISTTLLQHIF